MFFWEENYGEFFFFWSCIEWVYEWWMGSLSIVCFGLEDDMNSVWNERKREKEEGREGGEKREGVDVWLFLLIF